MKPVDEMSIEELDAYCEEIRSREREEMNAAGGEEAWLEKITVDAHGPTKEAHLARIAHRTLDLALACSTLGFRFGCGKDFPSTSFDEFVRAIESEFKNHGYITEDSVPFAKLLYGWYMWGVIDGGK